MASNLKFNSCCYTDVTAQKIQFITLYWGYCVRFVGFAAVTIKNAVFLDVTPYGSCRNQRFRGTYRFHHKGDKNR
jgi:hypothetical protein